MLTVEREPNTASRFINAVLAFRDQKQNQKQREAASPSKPATGLPDGSMDIIAAVNEGDLEEYMISKGCVLQDNGKYLHPNSTSGRAGISVFYKDGKQRSYSHHSPTTDKQAGKAQDLLDWRVHHEHGGDRDAALRAFGAEFTTEEGLTFNEHNLRIKKAADKLNRPDFEDLGEIPGTQKPPLFRDFTTIKYKDPEWLIKGVIETLSLVVVFAASGVGKTFLAISWLCAIATGRDWCGHAVKRGDAGYLAGEDPNGVVRRFAAWQSENQDIPPGALFISDRAVLLAMDGQADYLIAEIRRAGVDELAIVVIDTLARNNGGDENSTQDMSRLVAVCDRVRLTFKCTVLIVHHVGVGDDSRGRGSSVLKAAADAEFRMETKKHKIELTCTKAKNSAPMPKMFFRLEQVALGDGDTTSAVLVEDSGQHAFPDLSDLALNDFQTDIIDTLKSLDDDDSLGVPTLAELREATYAKWDAAGVSRDTSRQRFNRSIKKLKDLAAIKIDGDTDASYILLTVSGGDL